MARSAKRLMFIDSSRPPVNCGVGDYADRLSRACAKMGHSVLVITSAEFPIPPIIQKNFEQRPIIKRWHRNNFYQLIWPILQFRPHIVCFQYPSVLPGDVSSLSPWAAVLIKLVFPWIKIVYTVHEYHDTLMENKPALRRAFKFCFRVVAFDPRDLKELANDGVTHTLASRVGPNVSTASSNRPRETKEPYIVFFGRQKRGKGIEKLLSALAAIPKLQLLMIGETNPQYEKLAEKLGVQSRVLWIGHLPEDKIATYLQHACMAVFPFDDGMKANNGSVIAALANMCPVITTQGGGTPSWCHGNAAITLIGADDQIALQKHMALAATNIRSTEVTDALSTFKAFFSWQQIATEMLNDIGNQHEK